MGAARRAGFFKFMKRLYFAIHNLSRPNSPAIVARNCQSFWCQLRGLMLCGDLPAGEGLLLAQGGESRLGASIHMLFMRMDLAVVWINNAHQVVDVRLARRWRPAYFPRRAARYVLELNVKHLDDFKVDDQLRFEEIFLDR